MTEKDSAIAWSYASPTLPMDGRIRTSPQRMPNWIEVYVSRDSSGDLPSRYLTVLALRRKQPERSIELSWPMWNS